MFGLPYVRGEVFNPADMASASNSHGTQVFWWDFSLRLKHSAMSRLVSSRTTNRVALIPSLTGEASTVIRSLSVDAGIVSTFVELNAF